MKRSTSAVVLTPGTVVPLATMLFAMKVQRRGLRLRADGEDLVVVGCTEADLSALDRSRLWYERAALIAITLHERDGRPV